MGNLFQSLVQLRAEVETYVLPKRRIEYLIEAETLRPHNFRLQTSVGKETLPPKG